MHVYKMPNGRWRVIVQHGGHKRSAQRRTKGEALHTGAELLLELGGITNATQTTVGELVAGHLADADWSPSTLVDAGRVVARMPDAFARRPVRDITPAILDGLYRQLARDGWTPHRIRRLHMVLSVSFTQAATYGWCAHNPCLLAKPPAVEAARIRAPEHGQVRAILDAAGETFNVYMRVAVSTGCRRGEIVALRWEDIHFHTGEITIARSLVTLLEVDGGGFAERPTKTGSKAHRRLAIDDAAAAALRRLKAAHDDTAGQAGLAVDWVFTHNPGADEPWRPDYVSRLFRQACARAGVSGVRLHDIRHYVATTMLEDGEPPLDVAHQLGHASLATTLGTYAHHMPGRGRDSAERRAKRLEE